jgi:hypothetical protein
MLEHMQFINSQAFLSWARQRHIAPDTRYSDPRFLVYHPDRPHHRFWEFPQSAGQYPFFISHLIDGMEPWSECYLWPRGGWLIKDTSTQPAE